MATQRTVSRLITSTREMVAPGFPIRRALPAPGLPDLDPFLLLDHMGPIELAPRQGKGVPEHPHRGFQTITYMLAGRIEHKDSLGNADVIGPGDIQWMTAGSGLVHSELFEKDFREAGGMLHGFQIWVNLPKAHKMARPGYQLRKAAEIPVWTAPDEQATVRVIAGEMDDVSAAIDTFTPIMFLHAVVQPGGAVEIPIPREYAAGLYVVEGPALLGPDATTAQGGQLAPLKADGYGIRIAAPDTAGLPASVLVLGGKPLREPVASYGPFVMNNSRELMQAIEDYREGKMGRIDF